MRCVTCQPRGVLGMALCGRERADHAVGSLERLVAFSRAPIFVGMLGFAFRTPVVPQMRA